MANVFISHKTADTQEAEHIGQEIKNAGHNVWLDAWEIETGDSIIEEIEKGLGNADYVVLCLSMDGVMSKWISREWMSALARQLNGDGIKLIPIRLTGGDLPAILADIKLADLVADWSQGVQELLRSIR